MKKPARDARLARDDVEGRPRCSALADAGAHGGHDALRLVTVELALLGSGGLHAPNLAGRPAHGQAAPRSPERERRPAGRLLEPRGAARRLRLCGLPAWLVLRGGRGGVLELLLGSEERVEHLLAK